MHDHIIINISLSLCGCFRLYPGAQGPPSSLPIKGKEVLCTGSFTEGEFIRGRESEFDQLHYFACIQADTYIQCMPWLTTWPSKYVTMARMYIFCISMYVQIYVLPWCYNHFHCLCHLDLSLSLSLSLSHTHTHTQHTHTHTYSLPPPPPSLPLNRFWWYSTTVIKTLKLSLFPLTPQPRTSSMIETSRCS